MRREQEIDKERERVGRRNEDKNAACILFTHNKVDFVDESL